ncbi:MAG: outer membrane protein transport protein [Rhodobacteraceae bacterium]|nr:outer membrane protein transport protein [Paracoccaceae bacterium]MCF8515311.1 outer membrane protein transport protein [Paracoccaceae bacterium]MCF8519505.1 outer membrane protein transport protein [Paracoccaceae bacterium]
MKSTLMAVSALALSASAASAGGFERSALPIGFMFEKGNYAELSFGSVTPSVSGNLIAAPAITTGNVAQSYSTIGLAFKTDLNEKLSLGLTLDPTFGADVAYPTGTGYPIAGSNAKLRGDTIAVIARYKINDKVSVHGGLRSVGVGGNVSLFNGGTNFYSATIANKRDLGYLIGVAFEKPEIALRVALTYASETEHKLDVSGFSAFVPGAFTGATTTVKLPQALTLDFQSGVAKDTLVFGSIRWMDWSKTVLDAPNAGSANPLVSYASDTITYNIGVGRKFSDAISGAISIGYEEHKGGVVGNLGPTDGLLSLQVGGTYTHDNMKISAGVRYVDIGNATALSGAGSFSGNSAVAVGMKVGFSF